MAFESTQRTFDTTGGRVERTLTVKIRSGSVTIEASFDGVDWVLTDTIIVSGGWPIFQGVSKLRITPTGGSEFEFI